MMDEGQQSGPLPFVIAVGPLPPPIHGAAATTHHFIAYARQRLPIQVANISPGTRGGIMGHATKASRVVRAMFQLIFGAFGHPHRVIYMALDGQRGLAYNIAMALVARVTRYSIFVHHHSFAYIDQDSRLMQMLVRVIGARATHIVLCDCMTNGLRARYPEMARATAIELSSAAFVDVTARDDLRPADDIQIGFLSNLIIEKGLDTSIEFLRAARRENLPVKLLLAGRAPDERATTMVKEALLEFGDAINYLGPIPESEKQDFYHGIDAFIFPTRYINEAQPRAILESLAFGVPVLTIARSCITGDVGEGSGICVPPDGDFTAHALPLVREWCADRESLRRSSREAKQRSDVIYQLGQRQLAAVVDAFYPSAKAWRAVSSGRIAR